MASICQFIWNVPVFVLGLFWIGILDWFWTDWYQRVHQVLGPPHVWILQCVQHYCSSQHVDCHDVKFLPSKLVLISVAKYSIILTTKDLIIWQYWVTFYVKCNYTAVSCKIFSSGTTFVYFVMSIIQGDSNQILVNPNYVWKNSKFIVKNVHKQTSDKNVNKLRPFKRSLTLPTLR